LLARCVKASIRYNSSGEFNQSADNRRQGARPETMREHLLGASCLLKGRTELCAADYADLFANVQAQDVIYMDPPYQGVCGERDRRYIGGVEAIKFIETLRTLNANDVSYILSYDGQTGGKSFGKPLPSDLNLTHLFLEAGRSSQATLLGRDDHTVESLYLSPALVSRLPNIAPAPRRNVQTSFAEALL
jgi:DNA adenine methylase